MPRAIRTIAWTFAGLLATVLLGLGLLMLGANTDAGRRLLERAVAHFSHDHVRLVELTGHFPNDLRLHSLTLADDAGVWLEGTDLSLQWSPLALLNHRLQVQSASAARLRLQRRPLPGESSSSEGPSWLHSAQVTRVQIPQLELGAALVGEPAVLALEAEAHLRSLQDAQLRIAARRLNGQGEYGLNLALTAARWDIAARVNEPANGPLANLARLPGLGALSVTLQLTGPSESEQLRGQLSAGPLSAQLSGTLNVQGRTADIGFTVHSPALAPRADLTWQGLEAQGHWRGTLAAPEATAQLQLAGLTTQGGALRRLDLQLSSAATTLTLRGTLEGLQLPGPQAQLLATAPVMFEAELATATPGWPLRLSLSHPLLRLNGTARFSPLNAEGTLELPMLAALAPWTQLNLDGRGTLTAQLRTDRDRRTLSARGAFALRGGEGPLAGLLGSSPTVTLRASLRAGLPTLELAQVDGAGGQLSARGTMDAARRIDASWRGTLSNLSQLSAALHGQLTASGELHGPTGELGAQAEVNAQLAVHGSPLQPVRATLRAQRLLTAPDITLDVSGRLDDAPVDVAAALARDPGTRLRVNIARADWKSLHAQGSLSWPTRADAAGQAESPRGHLELTIAKLEDLQTLLGQPLRGRLEARADFGTEGARSAANRARIHVLADALQWQDYLGNVRIDGEGPIATLPLQVTAQTHLPKVGDTRLATTLALDVTHRSMNLSSLQLQVQSQTLRLLGPARVDFGDRLQVAHLRLGLQDAVLTVDGEFSPLLNLRATVRGVTPALVRTFAPDAAVDADGRLSADLTLAGTPAQPHGQLQLTAEGLHWRSGPAAALPPGSLHATVQLKDRQDATLSAALQMGSAQLQASGALPLTAQAAVDIRLQGALDLTAANGILGASGQRVRGQARVDGRLTGTPTAPSLAGTIQLSDGELQDYARGVHLTALNAALSAQEGHLTLTKLEARAGSGTVSASGTLGVLQPGLPLDLKLSLHDAEPLASNLLTARLDADLTLKGTLRERLDAAGHIAVSHADINIPNALPPNVAVLDVRRPGQRKPQESTSTRVLGLDISISAPRAVFVRGRGLDAEVGGELHLGGTQATPQVGGGFDLRNGRFNLAGKTLEFDSGRLSFNGEGLRGRIDPTLDFGASSTSGGYTAMLKIGGYADAPTLSLSSSPELPQDEVLARLLFGTSVTQLTALQLAQMGAAVAAIAGVGGSGGGTLANLQRRLGLDRLAIGGGGETGGATIEAGRYVSSRVYVGTKQSTAGGTQAQVEVDLSRHLKMQTTLGTGSGPVQGATPDNDPGSSIGLSYEFEY